MKIKCQYENASNACKEAPDKHCDKFNERCEIDIEISTPDLIAELERRRPCEKCENYSSKIEPPTCIFCMWNPDNMSRPNNFKEAK